jgi:chemotaxis protein methyltransferase CheR
LTKEHGFEIVGTATNGIEAAKKIKECNPDVMTLDIHMPEQDGIAYLKANFTSSHPPVVMVSSVSREAYDLALKALELGAADYVEKPAFSNLSERGDEIRVKLAYAYRNKNEKNRSDLKLDQSFSRPLTLVQPENKLRIIVAGLQDRKKLKDLFHELKGVQPPSLVLVVGSEGALPSLAGQFMQDWNHPISLLDNWSGNLKPGELYLGDFSKLWELAKNSMNSRQTSILVYGMVPQASSAKIAQWKNAQILIEDLSHENQTLRKVATDQVPATSFAYMSSKFFGDDHA